MELNEKNTELEAELKYLKEYKIQMLIAELKSKNERIKYLEKDCEGLKRALTNMNCNHEKCYGFMDDNSTPIHFKCAECDEHLELHQVRNIIRWKNI